MKKVLCIILSLVTALSSITAFAKDNITVKLDGTEIAFDVPPQIINGRTMVPMRAIFESLGATVNWEESTKIVTSVKGTTTISLAIDTPSIIINGNTNPLDAPPCIIDGRTLVPVRAISEAFNLNVEWDEANKVVNIESKSNIYNNSESPFSRLKKELISKGYYDNGYYYIFSYISNSIQIIAYDPNIENIFISYADNDSNLFILFPDNSDSFDLYFKGPKMPDNRISNIPKAYVTDSDDWANNISYMIGTSDSTVIQEYSNIVRLALRVAMVVLADNDISISIQDLGFVNFDLNAEKDYNLSDNYNTTTSKEDYNLNMCNTLKQALGKNSVLLDSDYNLRMSVDGEYINLSMSYAGVEATIKFTPSSDTFNFHFSYGKISIDQNLSKRVIMQDDYIIQFDTIKHSGEYNRYVQVDEENAPEMASMIIRIMCRSMQICFEDCSLSVDDVGFKLIY